MIWWIIAAVCAYYIKGICGFANTLIFTTILSFANSNVNISPVELILGAPSNLIVAVRERKLIQWKICLPLAAMVALGSIPGALFLKNADDGIIKIVFGIVIVFLGIEMLLREFQAKKTKKSKILLVSIGIMSGVLCGLYGIGALLGAYISRVTEDTQSFKANLCVVFLCDNVFRSALYAMWGIFTADILKQVLILMPFMLIGLLLGMLSVRFINEKIVRRIVVVMLILSGIMLISSNL